MAVSVARPSIYATLYKKSSPQRRAPTERNDRTLERCTRHVASPFIFCHFQRQANKNEALKSVIAGGIYLGQAGPRLSRLKHTNGRYLLNESCADRINILPSGTADLLNDRRRVEVVRPPLGVVIRHGIWVHVIYLHVIQNI